MKKRERGRPLKEPDDLITADQAVVVIKDYLRAKFKNEKIVEQCAYSKGTLYNKSSSGELHTWRRGKYALFSKAQILKLVS